MILSAELALGLLADFRRDERFSHDVLPLAHANFTSYGFVLSGLAQVGASVQ